MARVSVEKDISVPMRDGVVLKGDLYRPDSNQRLPVLLNRTPYGKGGPLLATVMDPIRAAAHGYNVLIVDCRGRFNSEGVWNCFTVEPHDGYDTIEWAAHQPWANGAVGTFGPSYMGATQWLAATAVPPSLKAMVPSITASNYHDGWTYQGGAFALGFNVSWTMSSLAPDRLMRERKNNPAAAAELGEVLAGIDDMRKWMEKTPLKSYELFRHGAPFFFEWLEHPSYDSYWQKIDIENYHDKINVPALNFGGWYDIFQGGTIRNYTGMRAHGGSAAAREGARLLMGPWAHMLPLGNLVGEVDYGYRAASVSVDLDGHALKFFDRHLKGIDKDTELPPVKLFVMGLNRWREENEWPLARTRWQRYYLHSRGRANSAAGDGALSSEAPGHEPPDAFLYNPLDPVPTRGGGLCCYAAVVPGGAYDQSAIEARSDVLVYTTEPLAEEVEVVGPVSLTLYASSSAPDTDFTAKLVDVDECGCLARNLTDGIIRARYRESRSHPVLLTPGKVYEYTIDMWSTANVFKKGHRIRLEISSSNFPRFDRNPNTGHDLFADAETRPALQTVLHQSGMASYLTLPVIPASD